MTQQSFEDAMPRLSFRSSFRSPFRIPALFTALCCTASAQMQMPACHQMPANAEMPSPEKLPPPQKLTGIGNLHFPISSKNPETQAWFDQGMNLVFDFWDYEANRAFEQAIRTDPNCAICHWALASSLGIHNQEAQGYAHDELTKAVALLNHADKREKLFIASAQAEAGIISSNGKKAKDGDEQSKEILHQIVKKYPKDIGARLLLSEAVSDGYNRETGKPKPGTEESMSILQGILKEKPDDSAANHLWIHAVEASPHPEQALHAAQILADLSPNSGHMTHMPGHIFYRTGDYARAQVSFDLSTSVDEAYMQAQHVSVDDDWNYVHNLMYSIANLMEAGQIAKAATVSAKLTNARGIHAASNYPWSVRDSITRLNTQLPIALRTGDWPQVEALAKAANPPANLPNLKLLADALVDFAEGMQSIESNHVEEASAESSQLDAQLWRLSQQVDEQTAADKKKPADPTASTTPKNQAQPIDATLPAMVKNLAILSLELRASILIRSGKLSEAEALFAQARREETDLGYHEPPAFIRPVAEQEADLLVAAHKNAEAEKAWKQALEDRPNSGFPLYGLALLAETSGNTEKTQQAYTTFLDAWKQADPTRPEIQHAQQWLVAHPDKALAQVEGYSSPATTSSEDARQ
jgi:tetratricopeptide (TPR) repeat protein